MAKLPCLGCGKRIKTKWLYCRKCDKEMIKNCERSEKIMNEKWKVNPQKMLNELLSTEFKKVGWKYGRIKIVWKTRCRDLLWMWLLKLLKIKDQSRKVSWVNYNPYLNRAGRPYYIIYLNKLYKDLLQNEKGLTEVLRHGCLRFELGFFVSNKAFSKEAQKRNIAIKAF